MIDFQLEKDEVVLNVRKSERSDTGRYKLQLKNPSGTAEGFLNVTVLGESFCIVEEIFNCHVSLKICHFVVNANIGPLSCFTK